MAPLFDRNGKLSGVVHSAKDITELKKMNQRFRQAQKMEALGTLAGGIAHDFNNILAAINGYTELNLLETAPGSKLQENLQQVEKASQRAGKLVNQILSFSRQSNQPRIPISPHLIIKEVLKLLKPSLPANIVVRQDLRSTAMVLADPTELHQVVMNLCTNAYLAMVAEGGEMLVELAGIELDEEGASHLPGLCSAPYLRVTVSDTGTGMSPETIEHIFEPYFTTREEGKGTGLGLAVVHGIVTSKGGAISVYSEPGHGSSFNVYLPLVEDAGGQEVEEEPASEICGGTEHVFLVDDDKAVLRVGQGMLERLGYQVDVFDDPRQVLVALENGSRPDLLLTDMSMPGLMGLELIRKARQCLAGLPVILCTGYSEQSMAAQINGLDLNGFIMKPFMFKVLASEVRRVLDRK